MGKISNWLSGLFARMASGPSASTIVEVPLNDLRKAVDHIPLEAPRAYEDRDAVAERWFRISALIDRSPDQHMDMHHHELRLMGQHLNDIGLSILNAGSERHTIPVKRKNIEFACRNMELLLIAEWGYERVEKKTLANVFSMPGRFTPQSIQIEQFSGKFEKMIKEIEEQEAKSAKPQATIISVGMPRGGKRTHKHDI